MTVCRKRLSKSLLQTSLTSSFALYASESDEDVKAKERALVQEKAKAYEDRMLKDAMQVTKNQQSFFSVAKFLIIPVIGLWIYATMSGSVLDVGTPAAGF